MRELESLFWVHDDSTIEEIIITDFYTADDKTVVNDKFIFNRDCCTSHNVFKLPDDAMQFALTLVAKDVSKLEHQMATNIIIIFNKFVRLVKFAKKE